MSQPSVSLSLSQLLTEACSVCSLLDFLDKAPPSPPTPPQVSIYCRPQWPTESTPRIAPTQRDGAVSLHLLTGIPRKPSPPESEKPVPPPGTYVIQIPKDQVYRVPPPENATRYKNYTRQNPRRSSCRCYFCWLFGLVAALIILSAAAAGIFYLVVRPKSPNYSIDSIAFTGFNMTALSPSYAISPEIQVTVRAQNPNKKIGIYYGKKSTVKLLYSDVKLCDGALPAFYQPSRNVTVFWTALKGSGIELTSAAQQGLVDAQKQGKVPLGLDIRMPVRIKVGPIKTWTINVKVGCDLTVDKLTTEAKIVSKDCDYSVDPW